MKIIDLWKAFAPHDFAPEPARPAPNPEQAWIDRHTAQMLADLEVFRETKRRYMDDAYRAAAERAFTDYLSAYNWACDTFEAA